MSVYKPKKLGKKDVLSEGLKDLSPNLKEHVKKTLSDKK
ncbi:hypothetical protein TCELL_0869 [Thermogladius calderae 1633]|uniref:Uncharacterized protein n=1 Tax=Thermogladius calderae (strain DSM 22663 / VKM B-2946 / 1633) TaxID=1184251 RepID=I3TEV5_THEC1|nr:hypothetical protein TCELL_0869 [Thermogladius calderae 1633]